MHADVTTGAVLEARIRHVVAGGLRGDPVPGPSGARSVVALEADGEGGGAFEEARIGRPVRLVATLTTVDANGGVFEDKGSAFVDVAFEAGFLVRKRLLHHARP